MKGGDNMSLKERIYSILLVAASDSFRAALSEILPTSRFQPLSFASNISEAKRALTDRTFDFVIISSPLPDESGIRFSIDCCNSFSTVVLLLVKSDLYPEVHDKVAEHGVFTLPKPTSRTILLQAIDWMISSRERLRKTEQKTLSIEDRMAEIRIVNRAKFLLISELQMTESEAHHYIEKYAMDNCIKKKAAAETIIKLYS